MLVLNDDEHKAIKRLLTECASQRREDMIGLFMLHGLFRELKQEQDNDSGLVNLVKKIEDDENKNFTRAVKTL